MSLSQYEFLKAEWIKNNPNATPSQYEKAMLSIARKCGVYMKWFKHDADASNDAKLKKLRLRYGAQGYGIYWYCLELIARNVEKHNLTFELEHDAELIADDFKLSADLIQHIMTYMIELGLFENTEGIITCLKMANRTDEYTQKLISHIKNKPDNVPTISAQSPTKSVLIEENRTEENRNTYVSNDVANCPHEEIIKLYAEHLPMLTQVKVWSDARMKLLKARWREDDKRQSLDWWARMFRYIATSDFLTGKTTDWQADIEWILNAKNFIKILEGKYENKS